MVEPQIRYDGGAVFLARALARAASVTKASTDSSEDVADVGLGLSICRSIIEAHGGKLWTLPRSPFGTTFYLTLPSDSPTVCTRRADDDAGGGNACPLARWCPNQSGLLPWRPTSISRTTVVSIAFAALHESGFQ
jgi:hypothetical protein